MMGRGGNARLRVQVQGFAAEVLNILQEALQDCCPTHQTQYGQSPHGVEEFSLIEVYIVCLFFKKQLMKKKKKPN